jgi:hypothetical protein
MGDIVDLDSFKKSKEDEVLQDLVDEACNAMTDEESVMSQEELSGLAIAATLSALDYLHEYDIEAEDNARAIADIHLVVEAMAGYIGRIQGTNLLIHNISDAVLDFDPPEDPFEATDAHVLLMSDFIYGKEDGDSA